MILSLTDLSSEPLQSQIVRQIRAKILTRELVPDTNLPSIRALARQQQVSVITVQRAYESLMRAELIHSRRGKGFFVSKMPKKRMKDMAKQRLYELLTPILSASVEEGLTLKDIREIVSLVLKAVEATPVLAKPN